MRIRSPSADDPNRHHLNVYGQCVRGECPACWKHKVEEFRKLCEAVGLLDCRHVYDTGEDVCCCGERNRARGKFT